jgi:soluble lytic murein transglycosylase-like protein
MMATSGAKGKINSTLYDIATKLATGKYSGVPATGGLSGITNFFTGTPAESALRDRAIKANDWYMSDAARTYFQQNPKLLVDAKKDPVTFYEKVTKGEAGLKTAIEPQPIPATKKALKYDQTQTEYDPLILQSAQQYGVDPIIFKRLLGSESSFQPDPTANRKIARGIAQIHVNNIKSGMISLQDALNPQAAIPFAAQLFSQYLQQSNGNYEQALQMYKGAISAQGKRSMAGIIGDILSGTQPVPTAPTVAKLEPAQISIGAGATPLPGQPGVQTQPQPLPGRPEDLQAQPRMYAGQNATPNPFITTPAAPAAPAAAPTPAKSAQPEANYYMANPQAITADMQAAIQARQFAVNQRNELARMAEIYMRSGTETGIQNAMNMRGTIMQMDAQLLESNNQMMYLQGMQGLQEFQLANDPRRLGAVWSQYAGVPVGIQPRSDGTYNIIVNGKKTKEGISANDISDVARSAFDTTYRQQKAETAKGMSVKSFEKQLDAQVEMVKQQSQMVREATVEAIKGRNKAMEIRLGREDFDIKPMGDGTARAWVYNKAGTALGVMDATTGQFVEMDGIKIPKGPTYTGVRGAPAGVSGNVR